MPKSFLGENKASLSLVKPQEFGGVTAVLLQGTG